MGRFLRRIRKRFEESQKEKFEEEKPAVARKDIRMISGCEDAQTSADVSNVNSFRLPDPHGRAGGACTSTLLKILYKDEHIPDDDYSFTEVLRLMRGILSDKGFTQIPQLTSLNPIDVSTKFDLVPDSATGTRRAVMIGINYVGHDPGELRGCHNDVMNMKKYIMDVHGFEEDNIVILMDDGENTEPSHDNILEAYKKIISESESGDAVFLHYSGHGTKLRDDDWGEEEDGFDEALVPLDFHDNGMIRDDDLYKILIEDLPEGVHLVSLMDCCHSGTILDLPYIFKGDGEQEKMELDEGIDLDAFLGRIGGKISGLFG
eukprot:CAMPEP_0119552190 /NCGR_PEP_ID=MMETSP1352-20130426/5255_1 /TAXON_ID=265584 /ORGANISM="Stauroneis constricta, Strain CCMP1120" /LENGTH=317 /DNA_ID=CAMNT_0007598383 /DNA_START=66 /DNA_END=1019 /DNA_ORIENTATION=+